MLTIVSLAQQHITFDKLDLFWCPANSGCQLPIRFSVHYNQIQISSEKISGPEKNAPPPRPPVELPGMFLAPVRAGGYYSETGLQTVVSVYVCHHVSVRFIYNITDIFSEVFLVPDSFRTCLAQLIRQPCRLRTSLPFPTTVNEFEDPYESDPGLSFHKTINFGQWHCGSRKIRSTVYGHLDCGSNG